jgi:hypothetical protein
MTIGKDGYGKNVIMGSDFCSIKATVGIFFGYGKSGYGGRWLWKEMTVFQILISFGWFSQRYFDFVFRNLN